MNDKALNAAVAKFLKTMNFTAQGEIEKALRTGFATGKLRGGETFTAAVTLTSEKVGLNVTLYSRIELR